MKTPRRTGPKTATEIQPTKQPANHSERKPYPRRVPRQIQRGEQNPRSNSHVALTRKRLRQDQKEKLHPKPQARTPTARRVPRKVHRGMQNPRPRNQGGFAGTMMQEVHMRDKKQRGSWSFSRKTKRGIEIQSLEVLLNREREVPKLVQHIPPGLMLAFP